MLTVIIYTVYLFLGEAVPEITLTTEIEEKKTKMMSRVNSQNKS